MLTLVGEAAESEAEETVVAAKCERSCRHSTSNEKRIRTPIDLERTDTTGRRIRSDVCIRSM